MVRGNGQGAGSGDVLLLRSSATSGRHEVHVDIIGEIDATSSGASPTSCSTPPSPARARSWSTSVNVSFLDSSGLHALVHARGRRVPGCRLGDRERGGAPSTGDDRLLRSPRERPDETDRARVARVNPSESGMGHRSLAEPRHDERTTQPGRRMFAHTSATSW